MGIGGLPDEPLMTQAEVDAMCAHFVEREACVMCADRYQGKDIQDGICPNHGGASTWHIVESDGGGECCACGHIGPFKPGILARRTPTGDGGTRG